MDYSTIIIVRILYYTDKLFFLIAVNSCAFQVYVYSGGCSKVYGYDPTFPVIYYQLTQTQLTDLN